MSIGKIFQTETVTVYCADAKSIYKPYPAKDSLLETAIEKGYVLNAGQDGETPFQIIVATKEDCVVESVSAPGLSCFSVEGIDIAGREFTRTAEIKAGRPWPLWCMLDASKIDGKKLPITVGFAGGNTISLSISLEVSEDYNASIDDADSLARLAWLNAKDGNENTLVNGFEPVRTDGKTIQILGRKVTLNNAGFIESIGTYFIGNNSTLASEPRELLSAPIAYVVYENGKPLDFVSDSLTITGEGETACHWQAENTFGELILSVAGTLEFDGSIKLSATLKHAEGRKLSLRLLHSPKAEFSKYFMGLGHIGGKTPKHYEWKWVSKKRQDSYWCGSVNGGVFLRPTAPDVVRPFVNIYFHHSKDYMPRVWENNGKGYFSLTTGEKNTLFFDSGEFLADGELTFCTDIMISPFKKTNLQHHWNTHYYHKNFNVIYNEDDIEDAKKTGCTHINLHHGNDTLPLLNYPMQEMEALRELANLAHKNGLGIKPYYTVRELTTRLPELFALRSLGTEIFPVPTYDQGGVPFQNGVDKFLTENFGNDVIPAWKHTFIGGKYDGTTDPTVVTNPNGRICNFYIGGLAWLVNQINIDGLYIDDVGYDKTIMRRVRRVFDKLNPSAKIDFHTCNHFMDSEKLGFGMGHNALIYMELFPYLNSLWVGECYDYDNNSPEYLLTEVSGIPFGVMGEMLEGDCNVWRGMLYGMTSRYPYYKCYTGPSPVPVWNMRKGFETGEMIGFWEDKKPIDADHEQVLCTTYFDREKNRLLCCFANFAEQEVSFKLCGTELKGRSIIVPYMKEIQEERRISATENITLPPKGGIMMILE